MSMNDKIKIQRMLNEANLDFYYPHEQEPPSLTNTAYREMLEQIEQLLEEERRAWTAEMNRIISESMANPECSRATAEASMRMWLGDWAKSR